jgi:hypothetical protein
MNTNRERIVSRTLTRSLLIIVILALTSLACSINLNGVTPTPGPVTPVSDDIVTLFVPLYRATLEPGNRVPMTQMVYVNRDGQNYNVTIDGLAATKRAGDSFSWRGVIAPGVVARYNLRLSPTLSGDNILVVGPVDVAILNPVPVELANLPPATQGSIHFTAIDIDTKIAKGDNIPGTTLVFEGEREEGALLSGTAGYPYRAMGDSLIWSGRLRGNVMVRYSLRVAGLSDEQLSLVGTAEIWIDENR